MVIRAHTARARVTFTYDEASSYLAATCHQAAILDSDFGPDPVEAQRWKRFLRMDERFCFGRIRSDLTRADFHPPLYFWLLHVWSLVFGVSVAAGLALNMLLATCTALGLYALARRSGSEPGVAALVAFTFAVNPAALSVSMEARPYTLVALLAVAMVYLTWHVSDPERGTRFSLLVATALVGVAGFLTHFHFGIFWMGCAVFAMARLMPGARGRAAATFGALVLAPVLAFILHPPFYQLQRHARRMGELGDYPFAARWDRVLGTLDAHLYAPVLTLAFFAALFGVAAWRQRSLRWLAPRKWNAALPLVFALITAGPIIMLYMIGSSPPHAMEPKYLAIAAPFWAFLPVLLLRLAPERRLTLAFLVLVPLALGMAPPMVAGGGEASVPAYLKSSNLVLIDSAEPGHVLPVVWHVPDSSLVMAAHQNELMARPSHWLNRLGTQSVYMPRISYDTRRQKSEWIARCIYAAGYDLEEAPVFGLGRAYRLSHTRPRSSTCR